VVLNTTSDGDVARENGATVLHWFLPLCIDSNHRLLATESLELWRSLTHTVTHAYLFTKDGLPEELQLIETTIKKYKKWQTSKKTKA